MSAPALLAEVTRRDVRDGREVVESRHLGHLVEVAGGRVAVARGTPGESVFVRSCAKPFQAAACLELLDDLAAELDAAEVAVAWASHRGEQRHLAAVRTLLRRSGTSEERLTCPPALAQADLVWPPASPGLPPSRIRFNCSGKHALFALAGARLGVARDALLDPDRGLQTMVLRRLATWLGPADAVAVDGCGAPAVAVPLHRLAGAYAALAQAPELAGVRRAGLAHPELVGGAGRIESALLRHGVVAKVGAEGVYGAGWVDPDGVAHGVAVASDDGAMRGTAVALLDHLERAGAVPPASWAPPPVLGGGRAVGRVRAVPPTG